MKKFLDEFGLATLQTILGWVIITIAYVNGDLDVLQAFGAITGNGIAAAAVGEVRNRAGKGVVRQRHKASRAGPRS